MEKRQLPNGPNASQRIYLIGRLRKAVKWATLFSQLCAVKADSRTSLEAEVCLLFPHLVMISLLQYFVPLSSWCSFLYDSLLQRWSTSEHFKCLYFLLFMELYAFSFYFI